MRRLLAVLLCVLPQCVLAQSGNTRLVGRVVGPDGREALAGVSVTLNGLSALTDAKGVFLIETAPGGRHELRFERIGYQTRTDSVTILDGATTDVVARLSQKPVELPPVAVTVRSRWLETNGFFDRRDRSGLSGRFIDRAEIERRNPAYLTDLFRDVSGARMHTGFSRRVIRFNRESNKGVVPALMPLTGIGDGFEAWLVKLAGCQPEVYIDGRPHHDRITRGVGRYVDDFNMIDPAVIEAMEVYVGANTPTEFRSEGCGVVLIWTRRN